MKKLKDNPRILVCVNEFFGALGTGKGGYGFIARNLLPQALEIPPQNIAFCIGRSRSLFFADYFTTEEGFTLVKLPKLRFLASRIVNEFDRIISIEATVDFVFSFKKRLKSKILFWIQDPRPASDWEEIGTVSLAKEPNYWNAKTYELVHECAKSGHLKFATQARFLRKKAIDLYGLEEDVPIEFLPNPVTIEENFDLGNTQKADEIIFLGRLDSVKRGWIFCEIARQMPQYNFFVLGASTSNLEARSNNILKQYENLSNLHFLGHVEGEEKAIRLRKAKILVNTSIHEALPVSFLEAFSYGTLVVSNQNPDQLTEKFGRYVGNVLGDGWDSVEKFVSEIDWIMKNEVWRKGKSQEARQYVREIHSPKNFRRLLEACFD